MDTHLSQAPSVAIVVRLPRPVATVLAVGAFLKNTVCLVRGSEALVSSDLGNLETAPALLAFEETVTAMLARAEGAVTAIAHDFHPDFPSTRFALELADRLEVPAIPVQHHHAHITAVMAEHGEDGPVLGLALDGFGLGADGGSWGGELLRVDRAGCQRLGHLAPLKQPGGDQAAREPWRMGAAALAALGRADEIAARYADRPGAPVIAQMLMGDIHSPATTSCGRLFDAACGLLGVKPVASFEGEAPMALEAMVTKPEVLANGWHLVDGVLDFRPLLGALVGRTAADGANLFHGTLAAGLATWVTEAARQTGLRRVALGGGCFLNRVLSGQLASRLREGGIEPLVPEALGPGDRAISLGQAWAVAINGR